MTLTPEEQAALAAAAAPAAPAQDPPQESSPEAVQPAPEPAPAPTAAPSQGSPWDADLASTFEDEATRKAVSEYLGQKVQPHVTRLEQASKAGRELIEALNSDPDATLKELVNTIYDEEDAKAILSAFDAEQVVQPDPEQTDLDPRVQALIDAKQEEEDKAAFLSEFDRVKTANPDLDLDFDLFVPFVAKAGDFDQAVVDYAAYLTRFREQFGTGQPATTEPGQTAPPALGTGAAAGVGSAPTEKEYTTIDEALEDTMAEMRAKGERLAPPVPSA